MTLWSGLWVPKDTPKDIVAKLNAAAVEAMNDPAVRKKFENLGLEMPPQGSAHAGSARRLAEGRDREMVADDQGRQRQGGVNHGRNVRRERVQGVRCDVHGLQQHTLVCQYIVGG